MKNRGVRCWIGVLALLVTLVPGFGMAVGPNLIVNGSFEEPALPWGSWSVFGAVPGWQTVSGCGIEIQNHAAGTPLAGGQLVELDSYCPTAMEQEIATIAGAVYTLRFGYSPRPGVHDSRIRAYWDGQPVADLSRSGAGFWNTDWEYVTVAVLGTGGPVRLAFADVSHPDSLGGYLDDISLTLATQIVGIAIKPGDGGAEPRPVNPGAKGALPVAILSSAAFDAAAVDPASVRFGPGGAAPVREGALGDVDGDGRPDLVLHFSSQQTGIAPGDTAACLTGLAGGVPIQGCQAIRTVPK